MESALTDHIPFYVTFTRNFTLWRHTALYDKVSREECMAKSESHLISTRDSNISPRAVGPRADIGRGHVHVFISGLQKFCILKPINNDRLIIWCFTPNRRYFDHITAGKYIINKISYPSKCLHN